MVRSSNSTHFTLQHSSYRYSYSDQKVCSAFCSPVGRAVTEKLKTQGWASFRTTSPYARKECYVIIHFGRCGSESLQEITCDSEALASQL